MVKKCLLLLISFLVLIFGGCAESSGASAGKIIPPSNQVSPLGGKWTVLQELDANGKTGDSTQQWIGSNIQFSKDAVGFGGHVWDKLSYKIKRVDAFDYLMTKYISTSGISIPNTQKVDVITVYNSSNFLGEFMKLDDSNMIFFVQDKELLLKKVSDQADRSLGASDSNLQNLNQNSNEGASGILLGLRIPEDAGDTYQTLWVAADHQKLHPVLESRQLFFPRTSGFWEMNVKNTSAGGKKANILTARSLAVKSLEKKKPEKSKDDQNDFDPAVRIIDYIGNDYIAIEKEADGVNRLQILPVDKLSSPSEIKVSDLLGDNGLNVYLSAREHVASALKDKGVISIEKDEAGENFGLVRKNGHWILTGRINYHSGDASKQTDFDLKVIPPANLVSYDTLVLNWHNIKDRVPDALDAFTSPKKDIVLVKTKNKLKVYTICAEQLSENPLAEIDLQEGATVIMAEWATGSYVENWEKSLTSYGAQALPGSSARMR